MGTPTDQTFFQFDRLPGELQDLIWDQAVNPKGIPCVQFFSDFDGNDKPFGDDVELDLKIPNKTPGAVRHEALLPSRLSRADGNFSMYMRDGGMWTACRGSRAAMHRAYFDTVGHRRRGDKDKDKDTDRDRAPVKASLKCLTGVPGMVRGVFRRGNELQQMTIRPGEDLLYLTSYWTVSSFATDCEQAAWKGFPWVEHIGIAYDPEWDGRGVGGPHGVPLTTDSLDGLKYDLTAHKPPISTLWLIDYRIKLPSVHSRRYPTFIGNGFKFFSVHNTMRRGRHINRETPTEEEITSGEAALDTMEYLDKIVSYPPEAIDSDSETNWIAPDIGILACVPDE